MKRIVISLIRVLVIALLVLSVFGLKVGVGSKNLCRIYLVDVSQSVTIKGRLPLDTALDFIKWDITNLQQEDLVGIAVFAGELNLQVRVTRVSQIQLPALLLRSGDTLKTDIAGAIRGIILFFPEDYIKEIYLLSDGRDNGEDLQEVIRFARHLGISITTIPIGPQEVVDLKIVDTKAPDFVSRGEKFDIEVKITGTTNCKARVVLSSRDVTREKIIWVYQESPVWADFPDLNYTSDLSLQVFSVYVEPTEGIDDCPQNNRVDLAIRERTQKTKILYISKVTETPISKLLKANPNFTVDISNANNGTTKDVFTYDIVVLDNCPASMFSEIEMKNIKSYVSEFGGGVLVFGGPEVFALGGYENKPIEDVLPVWAFPDERLSVVFVLDSSGSMSSEIAGLKKRKIEMAGDAIQSTLAFLRNRDFVSIIAFSNAPIEILPLRELSKRLEIYAKLSAISAYGTTLIIPALESAVKTLAGAKTNHRHIILLSDGKSREETVKFSQIKEAIEKLKISITVIGIGDEIDEERLKLLTPSQTGRFLHLRNFAELEETLKEDIVTRKGLIVGKDIPLRISSVDKNQVFKDIIDLPSIRKYNRVSSKEMALTVLRVEDSPLLSIWHYGKGKAGAFMTNLDEVWGGELFKWEGSYKFFGELVSYLARKSQTGTEDISIQSDIVGAQLVVEMVAKKGKDFLNDLEPQGLYKNIKEDLSRKIEFRQIGGGRYEGIIKPVLKGLYFLDIGFSNGGRYNAVINVPYEREFSTLGIDHDALGLIAKRGKGQFITNLKEYKTVSRRFVSIEKEIGIYLIGLAVVLFLIDLVLGTFWK
jgi:uncharacterized protein YegL